jgi:hypothetical protein
MLKFRVYRAAGVLSTIATLVVASGAGHKFS